MIRSFFALSLLLTTAQVHADEVNSSDEIVSTTVTDVSNQHANESSEVMDIIPPIILPSPNPGVIPILPTVTPAPGGITITTPTPIPGGLFPTPSVNPAVPNIGGAIGGLINQTTSTGAILGSLITLGQQVFQYVVENKPNAQYQSLLTSIGPSGMTDWTKLSGWGMPVQKTYHVSFKGMFNQTSGFDYVIGFVPGGNYQGHGKFLGNISFVPANVSLKTGRSLNVKAVLSDPINFGSVDEPMAAVQMTVTWSTPTTTSYQMNSKQYYIYANGQFQEMN
jgi:hypothetical protein